MLRTVGVIAVLAVLVLMVQPVLAQAPEKGQTHEGTVVKAGDMKITIKGTKSGDKDQTFTVPAEAKITCDGKACKLEDLKEGYKVKVTMKDDKTVSSIEGKKS